MRALLSAALVLILAACPPSSGPQGEDGPQGPAGAQGPQGPKGDRGDTGEVGPIGATGSNGASGPQGATGEQGVQGPAGTVLVLDGGVVVGPAGSSVVVTSIGIGSVACPTGGVRVTQVSDGGISNVCNGDIGPQGPVGAAGPIGATGSQGPVGAQGGVGPAGPVGAAGPIGATGSQGPVGAQGVAGPVGAQGASVTVTVLASMSPQCITGGVRIGYPDGGSSAVCNGDQGPQGIAGPQGVQGPQGLVGAIGPQGIQGGVGPAGATGAQGIQGVAGPTGPAGVGSAGPAGPVGPMGSTGPSGPPGSGYFVDGGVARADFIGFVGFTSNTYTGNLGGPAGANQKCNAEFPDTFFCTHSDYARSENAVIPSGAWIDAERNETGTRSSANCYLSGSGGWVNSTSDTGHTLTPLGTILGASCTVARPLSCCRKPRSISFRGFTTALFNGNLGGPAGANSKCNAEYPGSYFCTHSDYARSETTATSGSPAWIDAARNSTGTRSSANCYLSGSGGWVNGATDTGHTLTTLGTILGASCSVARPLACCQNN